MPPKTPQFTARSIFIPAAPSSSVKYHFFFIPGNPGGMPYYNVFLSHLSDEFSRKDCNVDIYAHAMANFYDDEHLESDIVEGRRPQGILGLKEQIDFVHDRLLEYIGSYAQPVKDGDDRIRIILAGHSVGSYIGMEVLRAWRNEGRTALLDGTGVVKNGTADRSRVEFVGFIGLWPTITWIGQSANGRRIGWILRMSHFAIIAALFMKILTSVVPRTVLLRVIETIAAQPHDAAIVTADFLSSKRSVQQAMHMARDEIMEINEDKWDEDFWGPAKSGSGIPTPRLIFYFGKNDQWVANRTRDELIAARGYREGSGEQWKAKMLIDDEGIPHDFCIRHSLISAKKTASFIEEVVQSNQAEHPVS